jgi:hypothetical protein
LYKTGNETTDKLIGVEFSGNIIHSQWYKTIVKKNGKADILAINILADIVYWYRPSEVKSEATGQLIGYKKKYKADLLQRSYDSYADQFGISKRQVTDAIKRLEELKVVKRDFRNLTTSSNLFLSNVLYLHLDFEMLFELSFSDTTKKSDTSNEKRIDDSPNADNSIDTHEIKRVVSRNFVGGVTQNSDTYTKTTPQITSKINKNKASSLPNDGIVDNFSEDALTIFRYFISSYMKHTKEVHPTVNKNVIDKLNGIIEFETIYDPDTDRELMIDLDSLYPMIDLYFDTTYPLSDGGQADHRIYHFLSDMVLKNLYYKTVY